MSLLNSDEILRILNDRDLIANPLGALVPWFIDEVTTADGRSLCLAFCTAVRFSGRSGDREFVRVHFPGVPRSVKVADVRQSLRPMFCQVARRLVAHWTDAELTADLLNEKICKGIADALETGAFNRGLQIDPPSEVILAPCGSIEARALKREYGSVSAVPSSTKVDERTRPVPESAKSLAHIFRALAACGMAVSPLVWLLVKSLCGTTPPAAEPSRSPAVSAVAAVSPSNPIVVVQPTQVVTVGPGGAATAPDATNALRQQPDVPLPPRPVATSPHPGAKPLDPLSELAREDGTYKLSGSDLFRWRGRLRGERVEICGRLYHGLDAAFVPKPRVVLEPDDRAGIIVLRWEDVPRDMAEGICLKPSRLYGQRVVLHGTVKSFREDRECVLSVSDWDRR